MKNVLSAAICLCALGAAQTAMADLRFVGNAGVASLTPEAEGGDKYDGYAGSLGVQYDVFGLPGVSAFVGGGLGVMAVGYDKTIAGIKVKLGVVETYVPVELGVQVSAIPLLRLQALAQYQHSLKGEVSSELGSLSASKDIESGNRVVVGGRALFSLMPFVSLGVYGNTLVSGKMKVEGASEEMKWDKGYEAGASLAISL